jgi:hypothetical protein
MNRRISYPDIGQILSAPSSDSTVDVLISVITI